MGNLSKEDLSGYACTAGVLHTKGQDVKSSAIGIVADGFMYKNLDKDSSGLIQEFFIGPLALILNFPIQAIGLAVIVFLITFFVSRIIYLKNTDVEAFKEQKAALLEVQDKMNRARYTYTGGAPTNVSAA